jgi:hypothetical protein
MHTFTRAAGLTMFLAAATLGAQQPGAPPPGVGGRPAFGLMAGVPGRGGASPVGATADFLLAHTGDLALTDAQVVRLAAISRRTEARRKALAARMDSAPAAARPAPGDSAGPGGRRRGPAGPPPAALQQARDRRDQMHADVRDAIAVLTPDQQANAWMMVAGGPALGGMPRGPMGPPPGRMEDGQQQFNRGSISRPPAPRDVPRRPEGGERGEP